MGSRATTTASRRRALPRPPAEATTYDLTTRCDRSDLPIASCAHCRGHELPAELEPLEPDVVDDRRVYVARAHHECGRCDEPIQPGDRVRRGGTRGGWLCPECAALEQETHPSSLIPADDWR